MKTLKEWQEGIWNTKRAIQDAPRKEIIEGLDIIAQDIMTGKNTVAHGNALLSIRYSLMSNTKKETEFIKLS